MPHGLVALLGAQARSSRVLMDAAPQAPAVEVAPAPEPVLLERIESHPCLMILQCRRKDAALIQIAPWLGVGAGFRNGDALASFSAGTDATLALVSLFQPPGGDNGGKLRLRLGPWAAVETPLGRVRGEGGLSMALRQEHFEAWGSFGLRGGVGVDTSGAKHWVLVVSWGIYGEPLGNEACWGACEAEPPWRGPDTFGLADGARFFVALRRGVDDPVSEWTFGLEFQPAWFWPLPSGHGYRRWRRH